MADEEPMRLVLTKDQREMVKRLSGQDMEVIELTPDEIDPSHGKGAMPKFLWRLSSTSGIPRQTWTTDDEEPSA
jgi:hypothetical protein